MKKYKVFESFQHQQKDAIVEYIKLVYGKDSMLMDIEDIQEKKAIAKEKSGIGIDLADEAVSKLILGFLREQNHYKHSLLVSKQELYWETLEIMREPLTKTKDDDKRLKNIKLKGDVNELCNKLATEINKLLDEIFGEEFKEQAQRTVVTFEQRLAVKR